MDFLKLAIEVSMHGNASGFLSGLASHALGVHKNLKEVEGTLDRISRLKLAVGGGLAIAGGTGLLSALRKVESAGERLVHAQTVFAAGLPAHERAARIMEVTAAATKEAGRNLNTTFSGNVEAIHDLYNTVQSIPHAIELLPAFNSLQTTLSSVKDGDAHLSTHDVAAAARAFELTGRTTTEALKHIGEEFAKTTIALRGRVDGSKMLGQIQTSGAARYGWSDDFVAKGFPALINILGNRTGSALNAIDNNLVGGVSSSEMQGKFQEKYGLHNREDEMLDKHGKFKGFKPNTVWKSDLLSHEPIEWANQYRQFLRGMGVAVDDTKAMMKVVNELARGNKFLKAGLDELLLPGPNTQLNKEIKNIDNVSPDAIEKLGSEDPKRKWDAFHKQWTNLLEAMGSPLVDKATKTLSSLTDAIKDVSQWAMVNPDRVKQIGEGLAALGLALTAGGAAALALALGPAGWLVAGLTALAVLKWDSLKEGVEELKSLNRSITDFAHDVGEVAGRVRKFTDKIGLTTPEVQGPQQPPKSVLGVGYAMPPDITTDEGQKIIALGKSLQRGSAPILSPKGFTADNDNKARDFAGSDLAKLSESLKDVFKGAVKPLEEVKAAFSGAEIPITATAKAVEHVSAAARIAPNSLDALAGAIASFASKAAAALGSVAKGAERIDSPMWQPQSFRATPSNVPVIKKASYDLPRSAEGMPRRDQPVQVSTAINLDGRTIAKAVTQHQVAKAHYPTATGGMDGYGTWVPPGTTLTDAA